MSTSSHAALMDGIYRRQRHIYDLTRKYYLLGRDGLIEGLDAAPGDTVLELGCGTGRNLAVAATHYSQARFFGLDISAEMLSTASAALAQKGLASRVTLAVGDATDFDPESLVGSGRFDRVFLSYSLSMIPGWQQAIAAALSALAPGGSLHIVDFGRQEHLPGWFRAALRNWLSRFHVTPCDSLREVLESESAKFGANLCFESLYRGYAVHAVITVGHPPA